MDVLAQRRQFGVGLDHVGAHVLGVRAGVADPLDPVDRVDPGEQLGERGPVLAAQIAAVGVDVLAQQRDLAHAVGGQPADLLHELRGGTADLAPARRGHDAVRAHAVAAHADLDPPLVIALPLGRKMPGEALELEEALGGERVAGQELGQLVDLAGAERDVDEREAREHLVLDRLGPAAADADYAVGALALEPLGLAEVGDESVVGVLADRAGVEQDQVGLLTATGLGVAERLEHPLHPLGVVLVHLAPERREVVALHRVANTR